MTLPPDIEFHEDLHLLIYRPHGVIDEAAVKKVVSFLEDLEEKMRRPFNRFFDTVGADEVELNFKYVIQVSLCRRLSYAGHPHVNDETRGIVQLAGVQKHFSRFKGCRAKTERLDEP